MTTQLWWHIARATGIIAWALLTAAVIWGLLLSTRLARGRPTPAWLLDMHRFLGGAAVIFTLLHLAGLVADTYVHFGLADLLVPYASSWRPGAVALGVVSLYLVVAVELTSLLMRRIPRRAWRGVHLTSFVLFWSATFHFILAGTDAGHPLARLAIHLAAATVVFLTLVRILSPRGHPRPRAQATNSGRSPLCRGRAHWFDDGASPARQARRSVVKAKIGDKIIVKGHHLGEPDRDAIVLEVHGADGDPPYVVRWSEDGHEGLYFPGTDATVVNYENSEHS